MKKFAPLLAILAIAVGLMVALLLRGGSGAGEDGAGDGGLGGAATSATTADGDASGAGRVGTPTDADASTEGDAQTPTAPTPADPPAWVPADAFDDQTGAIAATVKLTNGVLAVGAVATLHGPSPRQLFSDPQGHLLAPRLPPGGGYTLLVAFPGYATATRQDIQVTAGRVADLGTIDLGGGQGDQGPVTSVLVKVRERGSKSPIAGARVVFTTVRPYGLFLAFGTDGRPGEIALEATTDADGQARFQGIRSHLYDLVVIAKSYTIGVHKNVRVVRSTDKTLTLELRKGLTISGKVVRADGSPVAEADVVGVGIFGSFNTYPAVKSDDEGKFTLQNLDRGGYFVFAMKEGEGAAQRFGVPSGAKNIVLKLTAGGTVKGRVIDRVTGEPVPAFTVRPYRAGQPYEYVYSMARPFNDPEGRFEVPVGNGVHMLEIAAAGYALKEHPGAVANTEAEPITIALDAPGVVTGLVRRRGSGEPLPGAEVFVRKGGMPPSPHKRIFAVTGADGRFRLDDLPLRKLNLVVEHPELAGTVKEGVLPVAGDGTDIVVELSSGGVLVGTVRDDQGQPKAGITISLVQGVDFLNVLTRKSDADGAFRFDTVTPGRYSVTQGTVGPGGANNRTTVDIVDGQTTTVELGGQRKEGVDLHGRLTREGEPVADRSVSLFPEERTSAGEEAGTVNARTDADGRFVFTDVAPGRYTVFADVSGAVARETVVVPEEGESPEVELTLRLAGIAGKVVDVAGKPIGSVWVTLERVIAGGSGSLLQGFQGQSYTSEDGTFAMTGLDDGTYRLRTFVFGGTHGSEMRDRLVVSGGIGVSGLTIQLRSGREIAGRVLRTDGTPIAKATLRALDSSGLDVALIGFSDSGTDGTFAYPGLRAGVYTLVAEAAGYAPGVITVDLSTAVSRTVEFRLAPAAHLRIVVTDGEGKPVPGASIALLNQDGTLVTKGISITNFFEEAPTGTDAQGIGRWRDLAAGPYRVRVARAGFTTTEMNVSAVAGTETDVEVTLGG